MSRVFVVSNVTKVKLETKKNWITIVTNKGEFTIQKDTFSGISVLPFSRNSHGSIYVQSRDVILEIQVTDQNLYNAARNELIKLITD